MTKKKAIPSIHVPIMTSNGSMELAWYLYLQYLAEGGGATTVSVEVNSTETVAPGTDAEVTNAGDEVNVKLDFKIPRGQQGIQGPQGPAATVSVGTTTTLPAGSQATVTNVGTPSAAVFNFGIPKGDPGQTPTVGNGTITITQGGTTVGSFTTNQSGDTTIDLDAGGGSAQSVGNVFWTMRNDNELNGAVECDGATYNTTDFTGAQSIGALLAAGKVPYVSLSQYATLLSTQGSVGVFGWNGGNATTFRVPSLNDIFVETGTAAQVGDYLPAGLPNITGEIQIERASNNNTATGAFYISDNTTLSDRSAGASTQKLAGIDASRSSSVYKDDVTTVQPNTIRYRAMVQLATSASDEALEICTGVLADVAALKYDYVVEFQAPIAANNYTWYRKYKSGWIEQGGLATIPSRTNSGGSSVSVVFPVAMTDTNYTGQLSFQNGGAYYANCMLTIKNRQTTGADLEFYMNASGTTAAFLIGWQVSGMAAS